MPIELNRQTLKNNPFEQFELWLQAAQAAGMLHPAAMSVATASAAGAVSSRMMMLRYFDKRGFVFFSSYATLTARQLDENPQVSLLFPWLALEKQVKVGGTAVKIPKTESLRYFASRHKESQMGVWLAHDGGVVSSKALLQTKLAEIKRKFREGQVPMPDAWGGYRVAPQTVEFWQGQPDGLHDRFVYVRKDAGWEVSRLMP